MFNADNGANDCGNKDSKAAKVKDQIPLRISTTNKEIINSEDPGNQVHDTSTSLPWRLRFLKLGSLASPSAKLQQIAEERDEISRKVPSSSSIHIHERINRIFSQKIDLISLQKMCKEWIRNPLNMTLFVWITCVAVSGAILFLVMTGMLNSALPKKSQRDTWFEVNNQILNALFTLMCLYQHPKRFYHLALLLRWKQEDISKLRKFYCKNGTYKPHEWVHMLVVIALLHINCFAQYALCGLNLGYKRSKRPAVGVGICISVAIAAPAIAGVYSILSPLGKEYHIDMDEEAQLRIAAFEIYRPEMLKSKSFEKRFSFASRDERKVVESRPQWSGGVLDFWDDISLAYLSLFCSCCVFGWNMERLGFGNRYVHIVTFILFCSAPSLIFNLAAVNIDNNIARQALGIVGIFLCAFGLMYGGFWRIQMRKRFNLPPYSFCCGKPAVTDCALWLCCCWCSLAQEVRTGNSYDVVEDKLYRKNVDVSVTSPIPDLTCEGEEFEHRSGPSSPPLDSFSPSYIVKGTSSIGKDETMTPPSPSLIQREIK